MHFHIYTSGCLLDFVTPAELTCETSLSSLELDSLRWSKLADGKDIFDPRYRWHYCTVNAEGTHAWLLGSCIEPSADGNGTTGNEYLSDVLAIDLRKFGVLGNELASSALGKIPSSDANVSSSLSGIGADLSMTFDQPPETGSGADFIVTADPDDADLEVAGTGSDASNTVVAPVSRPIHVHRLILHARWPHFARMWAAQMQEYHNKKMHIPEPYSAVRAFLFYLYTDSIAPNPPNGPTLSDVAGMLIMANMYDMPRLRLLCRNRLYREMDIEHAAVIWVSAHTAQEPWLKACAAQFCLENWGRVVRTEGFKTLDHASLIELCQEPDPDARVFCGEDLEKFGMLGGRFGVASGSRKRNYPGAIAVQDEDDEVDEDDDMDVN